MTPEERQLMEQELIELESEFDRESAEEELAALEKQELIEKPAEIKDEDESGFNLGAAAMSALDEFTFSTAPEIIAAGQAAGDILSGDSSLSEFTAVQDKYAKENREVFDASAADNPVESIGGALLGATGQVVLGSGTAIGKQMFTTFRGALANGALHGVGRTQDLLSTEGFLDIAAMSAIGGAGFGLGTAVGKATGAIAKKSKELNLGDEKVLHFLKSMGLEGQNSLKTIRQTAIEGRGITDAEYLDDILTTVDFKNVTDEVSLRSAIRNAKEQAGESMELIFNQVDSEMGGGFIRSDDLVTSIRNEMTIADPLISEDEVLRYVSKRLGINTEVPELFTLKDVQIRKNWNGKVISRSGAGSKTNDLALAVNRAIRDTMDTELDKTTQVLGFRGEDLKVLRRQ